MPDKKVLKPYNVPKAISKRMRPGHEMTLYTRDRKALKVRVAKERKARKKTRTPRQRRRKRRK